MTPIPFAIRPPTPEDIPVVVDNWLRSMRDDGVNGRMTNAVFYPLHRPRVTRLLQTSPVLVGCNPADSWQVYGWLCGGAGVLHYAYTKEPFRRMGIMARLVDAAGLEGATTTATGLKWEALQTRFGFVFDPRGGQ